MTRLNWHGREVAEKIQRATEAGIDDTMADAVIQAKSHHPGWRNRTGTAEGSVRIIEPAHRDGQGTVGVWGSMGVNYVLALELQRGSFLRNAADDAYPQLEGRIRQHFERGLF